MRLIFVLIWLWLASSAWADGIMMGTTGTAGGGGGGGGGAGVAAVTWDPASSSYFTYSNGNLTATCSSCAGGTAGATTVTTSYPTNSTAKVYFEITANFTGTSTNFQVGVADATTIAALSVEGPGGVAYAATATGNFTIAGPPTVTIAPYTTGTVVAYAIDWGTHKLWTKSGCAGLWNNNFNTPGEDPVAEVGGWPINPGADWTPSGPVKIGYSDGFTSTTTHNAVLNDGPSFTCTVPTGYSKW